jgi:hypothetical protein
MKPDGVYPTRRLTEIELVEERPFKQSGSALLVVISPCCWLVGFFNYAGFKGMIIDRPNNQPHKKKS